ncbi:MAG TPA: hypothetical protein VGD21_13885 [Lysobacter sp.]
MNRSVSMLVLVTALAACASAGTARGVSPGQAFMMQPGERVALPDQSALHYVGVVNDSRCPPDVQCIRAGDATVAFEFTPSGGAKQDVTLNTDSPTSLPIGSWQLHLLALARGEAPEATVRVDAR